MNHILVTGFEPFDGRLINASWIVAAAAAASVNANCLRLPVSWGAAGQLLLDYCSQHHPDAIIALGEGGPEGFRLETLASNQRKDRPDNRGNRPGSPPVDPDGPDQRRASFPHDALLTRLEACGYRVRLSSDAGGFLCDETLYILEGLRESQPGLNHVAFVHVPPYDTLNVDYAQFGKTLIRCCLELMASQPSARHRNLTPGSTAVL